VALLPLVFPLGSLAAPGPGGGHPGPGASYRNTVEVHNYTDDATQVDRQAQLNVIDPRAVDGEVDPQNAVVSYGSCVGCSTITVALHLDLVLPGDIPEANPANVAYAVNDNCDGCTTLSRACQEVTSVGGPRDVLLALWH